MSTQTRNWSIISTVLMLVALGWVATQPTPYIAAVIAFFGCTAGAMALIRYEDSINFTGN